MGVGGPRRQQSCQAVNVSNARKLAWPAHSAWAVLEAVRQKLTEDDIEAAKVMLANPDISVTQIAHRLGVSPAPLYRYVPAARTANTPTAADFS